MKQLDMSAFSGTCQRPERHGTKSCRLCRCRQQQHKASSVALQVRNTKFAPSQTANRGGLTSTSASTGQSSSPSVNFGQGDAPWEVLQSIGIRNKAEVARILDIAENPKSLLRDPNDKDDRGNPLAKKLDADKDMRPLLDFLLANGFSEADIPKVIIEYPTLLCYDPKSRLEPLFDYLKGIGIESPDRLVMKRPSVLGIDPDKGLKRIVEYLQQNDHTPAQIEELLATSL